MLTKTRLVVVKLILTSVVCLLLALPLLFPAMESGFVREFRALGMTGAIIVIVVFLVMVFFYCRDLQSILEKVHSQNRLAEPRSVWFMFAIPYNFVEDFFIIYNVSQAISREARTNKTFFIQDGRNGITLGLGWCCAQIISILPGIIGQIAGLLALVLWLAHWWFIRYVIRLLSVDSR